MFVDLKWTSATLKPWNVLHSVGSPRAKSIDLVIPSNLEAQNHHAHSVYLDLPFRNHTQYPQEIEIRIRTWLGTGTLARARGDENDQRERSAITGQ